LLIGADVALSMNSSKGRFLGALVVRPLALRLLVESLGHFLVSSDELTSVLIPNRNRSTCFFDAF
tara:strand:+ start:186 stop:380 length:195 start_codon:yes stop_codon:yes gene_type:complete